MKTAELRDILKSHALWLRRLKGGARANLADRVLTGRQMPGVNLRSAILTGIDLSHCALMNADFAEADLNTQYKTDFRRHTCANIRRGTINNAISIG